MDLEQLYGIPFGVLIVQIFSTSHHNPQRMWNSIPHRFWRQVRSLTWAVHFQIVAYRSRWGLGERLCPLGIPQLRCCCGGPNKFHPNLTSILHDIDPRFRIYRGPNNRSKRRLHPILQHYLLRCRGRVSNLDVKGYSGLLAGSLWGIKDKLYSDK
jgi:hypothetical protein